MKPRAMMSIPVATMLAVAALFANTVGAAADNGKDGFRTVEDSSVAQEAPAPDNKPSKPADSSPEAASEAVSAVANHIYSRWRASGYVSQRTDADKLTVSVRWSGAVPDDLETYAASRPWGVSVVVKTGARYDRATLWSGRDQVLQDPIADDIRIKTTELNMDGSGITLGVLTKTPLSDSQMRRLKDISGIDDISVSTVDDSNHLFSSRDNGAFPIKAAIARPHT